VTSPSRTYFWINIFVGPGKTLINLDFSVRFYGLRLRFGLQQHFYQPIIWYKEYSYRLWLGICLFDRNSSRTNKRCWSRSTSYLAKSTFL